MSDIRKKLSDMKKDLSDVQTTIIETTAASDNLTKKISGLASSNTKGGALWSVIGRFSSGGVFYDIQNKTRSIAFLFKLKENFDKERNKKEQELNIILGNGLKRRKKLYEFAKLEGATKLGALQKSKLLEDDMLKIQMKQYGFAEAISRQTISAQKALKESVVGESKAVDSEAYMKRMKEEGKSKLFQEQLGGAFKGSSTLMGRTADRQDLAVGIHSKKDELNEVIITQMELRAELLEEGNKWTELQNQKEMLEPQVEKRDIMIEERKQLLLKKFKYKNDLENAQWAAAHFMNKEESEEDYLARRKAIQAKIKEHEEEEEKIRLTIRKNHKVAKNKRDEAFLAKVIVDEDLLKIALIKIDDEKKALVTIQNKRVAYFAHQDTLNDKIDEANRTMTEKDQDQRRAERENNAKIKDLNEDILYMKGASVVEVEKLTQEIAAQREVQGLINSHLDDTSHLIESYNHELEILKENAEESGLISIEEDERDVDGVSDIRLGTKDKRKMGFGGKMLSAIGGGLIGKKGKSNWAEAARVLGKKLGFDKRKISKVFKFAKMGTAMFAQVLLTITGVALAVFLLKQSGFFDKISGFYDFLIEKGYFELIKDGFSDAFEGIFALATGVVELITALFGGESGEAMVAVGKIGDALLLLGTGLGKLMLYGAIGFFVLILWKMWDNLLSRGSAIIKKFQDEGFTKGIKFLLGMLLKRFLLSVVGAGVGAALGFWKGGPVGAALGFKVGAMVGGLAGFMEDGGVTGVPGNYLVGEGGPEIVSLPGNTRVHNNSDTRKMLGNTINVNVSGRVGASEQELNDIARRIGQKVNLEMNRYSNSGYRG